MLKPLLRTENDLGALVIRSAGALSLDRLLAKKGGAS